MKLKFFIFINLFFSFLSAQSQKPDIAQTPPMGWNSFDSYGVYLHEKAALDNMKILAEKYKPFGHLQLMSPSQTKDEKTVLLSGKGNSRQSQLSPAQMRTFITLRALSASPLMIGGDLLSMDNYSYSLLTNKEMLAVNQNGIMGSLIYNKDGIEIWKTPQKKGKGGWIGIFNRNNVDKLCQFHLKDLNLKQKNQLLDVWNNILNPDISKTWNIGANDVIFICYR